MQLCKKVIDVISATSDETNCWSCACQLPTVSLSSSSTESRVSWVSGAWQIAHWHPAPFLYTLVQKKFHIVFSQVVSNSQSNNKIQTLTMITASNIACIDVSAAQGIKQSVHTYRSSV